MLHDAFIYNCSSQKAELQQYAFAVAAGTHPLCLQLCYLEAVVVNMVFITLPVPVS